VSAAGALVLSLIAGAFSVLSPCVLPLLPIVLGAAIAQGRLVPLALIGGLVLSFAATGLLLATIGFALSIDEAVSRGLAAGLLGLFGLALLLPALQRLLSGSLDRPLDGLRNWTGAFAAEGATGQLLLGLLLGVIWSPCTGPSLGAAIGLAEQNRRLAWAGAVMAAYGLGAALPLVALSQGLGRVALLKVGRLGRPALGCILVANAGLILTGLDRQVEALGVAIMPYWLSDLASRY
jgi:cytochrome c biogenesis protein CcdA